jgi:type I site-specific restriction endonuclease
MDKAIKKEKKLIDKGMERLEKMDKKNDKKHEKMGMKKAMKKKGC